MMHSEPDQQTDPAAASVSLAAEAAVLEARLRMLREALDGVDTRIEEVSEALRRVRRSASSASAGEHGHPPDARDAAGDGRHVGEDAGFAPRRRRPPRHP